MSVSSLYQNEGYLMSQIEPAETIIAPDSIDIEVKVFEGKQFTINEVGITGNQRVDDEVIRRELYTRPGELYNRSLLMRTIRLLGSMGRFNPEPSCPTSSPFRTSWSTSTGRLKSRLPTSSTSPAAGVREPS